MPNSAARTSMRSTIPRHRWRPAAKASRHPSRRCTADRPVERARETSGRDRRPLAQPATKKPASPPAFLTRCEATELSALLPARPAPAGDGALDRGLHLLKSTDLDLPHALARYAELGGEVFKRHRIFRQTPRFEDTPFARVEHADGAGQRLTAMIELLVLGHDGFLVGRVTDQPVLPFAGFTIVADRRVERGIAAEPAVHVDHVLIRDAEALCNQLHLVGVQIALVQC